MPSLNAAQTRCTAVRRCLASRAACAATPPPRAAAPARPPPRCALRRVLSLPCAAAPTPRNRRALCAALPAWASALAPSARDAGAASSSAATVVRRFYAAVNARDLDAALACIDQDCTYEDMIYAAPFIGRAAVAAHLRNIFAALPADMAFVIDDITAEGSAAVGLTWHVELGGTPFPFGRGASFVRLAPRGCGIGYVRDVPEPSSKPGGLALSALGLLAKLLRALPGALPAAAAAAGALPQQRQATEQSELQQEPQEPPPLPRWVSPALWAVFAAYAYALLIGTELPGEPAWDIQPHTIQSVVDLSLDFFYVAPLAAQAGLPLPFPAPPVHPAELALFNLVNAWSLMFLGLLAADARGRRLPLLPVWSGQMFLTNVFLLPWLAARAAAPPPAQPADSAAGDAADDAAARLPPPLAALAASPALGVVGGAVGVASVFWFCFAALPGAAPDAAAAAAADSLGARWQHLADVAAADRLTLAFFVDCAVYSAAQAWLIADERAAIAAADPEAALPPAWQRFVPFAGLAAWLATRPQARQSAL